MNDDKRLGLSFITNFGCDTGCSYCIWNNHPLKNIHGPNNWSKISNILSFFPQEKISISGGGDPLFQFPDKFKNWNRSGRFMKYWYTNLFKICEKLNRKIDMHTSKIIDDIDFVKRFNKWVLHLDWERFRKHRKRLMNFPIPLRINFVFWPTLTLPRVNRLVKFANEYGLQLSFREYYRPPYVDGLESEMEMWFNAGRRDEYYDICDTIIEHEAKYQNVRYVHQNDYNVYYMPNDQVYTDFMCRRKPIC